MRKYKIVKTSQDDDSKINETYILICEFNIYSVNLIVFYPDLLSIVTSLINNQSEIIVWAQVHLLEVGFSLEHICEFDSFDELKEKFPEFLV